MWIYVEFSPSLRVLIHIILSSWISINVCFNSNWCYIQYTRTKSKTPNIFLSKESAGLKKNKNCKNRTKKQGFRQTQKMKLFSSGNVLWSKNRKWRERTQKHWKILTNLKMSGWYWCDKGPTREIDKRRYKSSNQKNEKCPARVVCLLFMTTRIMVLI